MASVPTNDLRERTNDQIPCPLRLSLVLFVLVAADRDDFLIEGAGRIAQPRLFDGVIHNHFGVACWENWDPNQAHRETKGGAMPFRSQRGINGGWHCR